MINSKFPLSEKQLKFLEKYEKADIHFTLLEGTTDAYRNDELLFSQFPKDYADYLKEEGFVSAKEFFRE